MMPPSNYTQKLFLMLVASFLLIGTVSADAVTLYPNSSGNYGYFGRLTPETSTHTNACQYGTGTTTCAGILASSKTIITTANLDAMSSIGGAAFAAAGSNSQDAFAYVNFTLSDVQSVNSVNISVRSYDTSTSDYTIVGLYNKTNSPYTDYGGGWTRYSTHNVATYQWMNKSLVSEVDKATYTELQDHVLRVSVMSWVNGSANANIATDYISVVIDYEPYIPATFMPPFPVSCSATTGNFWVNTSCSAGTGNITNAMNKSINGVWQNTSAFYYLSTLTSHAWQNVSYYAFNSSAGGILNTTPATLNTQIPNNAPIMSIGAKNVNEGSCSNFSVSSYVSDADSDTLTYAKNGSSKGDLVGSSYSYCPDYTESGTYIVNFSVDDGYSGLDYELVTFTVSNIVLSINTYSPAVDTESYSSASKSFSVGTTKPADITWYINGTLKGTSTSTISSNYVNASGETGYWNVTAIADDGTDIVSHIWNWSVYLQGFRYQTQNGTTTQYINDTDVNVTWASKTNTTFLYPTENATGWYNVSIWNNKTGSVSIIAANVWKNGVNFENEHAGNVEEMCQNCVYNFTYYGQINTTDIFWIQTYKTGAGTVYILNVSIVYDHVPAPTITSPVNNSVQISKMLNITWTSAGPAPYEYIISQQSDCLSPYLTGTTSDMFSSNQTLNTGLNYICIRGYNLTSDSVTDWATPQSIYVGNNDTVDSSDPWSLDNTTWSNSSNILLLGRVYKDFGTNCDGWTYYTGTWTCSGGYMNQSDNTASAARAILNNSETFSNVDIVMKIKSTSFTSANGTGLILNYINGSALVLLWAESGLARIYEYMPARYLNSTGITTDDSSSLGTWFYHESQYDGSSYKERYTSTIWNNDTWQSVGTDSTWLNGSVGVNIKRRGVDIDYFWVRNTTMDGDLVSIGNATYIYDLYDKVLDAISYNTLFASENENISLYISSSHDGLVYGNETLISLITDTSTNNYLFSVPSADKTNRYKKIRLYFNSSQYYSISGMMNNISLYWNNKTIIEGYVHYPNGTAVSGARVVTYGSSNNTDASGHYVIYDSPTQDVGIAAGISGFAAVGGVVNISGNTTHFYNFTLLNKTSYIPNVFYNKSILLLERWLPSIHENGSIDPVALMPDQCDCSEYDFWQLNPWSALYEANLARALDIGLNQTPDFLERTIMATNYRNTTIQLLDSQEISSSDFYMFGFTGSMRYIKDYTNDSTYSNWNFTLNNWNTSNYTIVDGATYSEYTDPAYSGSLHNHLSIIWSSEWNRYNIGNTGANLTEIRTMVDKWINFVQDDGSTNDGYELAPASHYTAAWIYYTMRLDSEGYIHSNESAFHDAINSSKNYIKGIELQDGNIVLTGRSAGFSGGYPVQIAISMMDTTNKSDSYRRADRIWTKMQEYEFWYDGTLYSDGLHYYRPSWFKYLGELSTESCIARFLMDAGVNYDSSIVEATVTHNNFDGMVCENCTRILVLNNEQTGIYMMTKYYPFLDNYPGSGVIPMRPIIIREDAVSPIAGHLIDADIRGRLMPFFDNGTYINVTATNWTNVSYSLTANSMHVNWSEIYYGNILLGYLNISVALSNNIAHIKYTYNFTDLSPVNYSIPILYLSTNNRTNANVSITDTSLNYSFGTETMNISNLSAVGGTAIFEATNLSGRSLVGMNNGTLINGSISGSSLVIEYDITMNTSNSYGFSLNQPPGILDYSPETPLTIGLNSEQQFSISFSQNNINISWQINGTEVQTNTSVSGGATSYYTNTSGTAGLWNLSAIGCNVQGCAMQSWDWTIINSPPSPITSLSANTTVGLKSISYNWTNPSDPDFSHVWVRKLDGTQARDNISINYTTVDTFDWHENTNVSFQTVDTAGNINTTKVWSNNTIPNNLVTISSFDSVTIVAGQNLTIYAEILSSNNIDNDNYVWNDNATEWQVSEITNTYNEWQGESGRIAKVDWTSSAGDIGNHIWYINATNSTYGDSNQSDLNVTINSQPTGTMQVTNSTTIQRANNITRRVNSSSPFNLLNLQLLRNVTGTMNISYDSYWAGTRIIIQKNGVNVTTEHEDIIDGWDTYTETISGAHNWTDVFTLQSWTLESNIVRNFQISYTEGDLVNESAPSPNITSNLNNITNDADLSFDLNINNAVLFSVGADQNITNWTWTGATQIGGNGTTNSTADKSFTSAGLQTVTVNGTNTNGTTSTLTWLVNVVTGGGQGINWDWATFNVKYINGTGIGTALIETTEGNFYTDATGTVDTGYVFEDGQTYWINVSKSGFTSNNTQLLFNEDNEIYTVYLTPIVAETYSPNITSWANDNTSDSNISISVPSNTNITFNITVNQSVTTSWSGSASPTKLNGTNELTSYAFKNFTSVGTYTVIATCTNVNGTCLNSITWTVTVTGIGGLSLTGYVSNGLGAMLKDARVDLGDSYDFTDANGYYSLSNVSEGNYSILARQIGYRNSTNISYINSSIVVNFTLAERISAQVVPGFELIIVIISIAGLYYFRKKE